MKAKEIINEATFNVGKDVDFLYNKLFRKTVNAILKDKWDGTLPDIIHMTTSELPSRKSQKAHNVNPMRIITTHDNEYNPNNRFISISIGGGALALIRNEGSFSKAIAFLKEYHPADVVKFKGDISPARIKGTIYHELAHWLDDTYHNKHIKDKLDRAVSSDGHSLMHGEKNVGLTRYEINSQIHAIKQLKRDNLDKWDDLSFKAMVNLNASHLSILRDLSHADKIRWKKMILKRMAREGLVGNRMQSTY